MQARSRAPSLRGDRKGGQGARQVDGVGGVGEDLEFQTWLMQLGMRYLTGGSDVGYNLCADRADVERLRKVQLS